MNTRVNMTIEEHIICVMEDLNNENFDELDDKDAKRLIEKGKTISELAAAYNESVRTRHEETRIKLDAISLIGKFNLNKKEYLPALGIDITTEPQHEKNYNEFS